MGKGNALGFIESVGLASAIAAADAALKAANVELIGRENSRGFGYITIKISGEVGAVQAAISAAKAASAKVARVWSVDVIPRPTKDLGPVLVWNPETQGAGDWISSRAPDASRLAVRGEAPLAKKPEEKREIVAVEEDIPKPAIPSRQTKEIAEVKPETSQETKGKAGTPKKPTPRRKPGGRGKKAK